MIAEVLVFFEKKQEMFEDNSGVAALAVALRHMPLVIV